jgi:hypothetical protein
MSLCLDPHYALPAASCQGRGAAVAVERRGAEWERAALGSRQRDGPVGSLVIRARCVGPKQQLSRAGYT